MSFELAMIIRTSKAQGPDRARACAEPHGVQCFAHLELETRARVPSLQLVS